MPPPKKNNLWQELNIKPVVPREKFCLPYINGFSFHILLDGINILGYHWSVFSLFNIFPICWSNHKEL